jgi:hypothetical protein
MVRLSMSWSALLIAGAVATACTDSPSTDTSGASEGSGGDTTGTGGTTGTTSASTGGKGGGGEGGGGEGGGGEGGACADPCPPEPPTSSDACVCVTSKACEYDRCDTSSAVIYHATCTSTEQNWTVEALACQ